MDGQGQNFHVYNTFSIANDRNITHTQVEVENGIYYPENGCINL